MHLNFTASNSGITLKTGKGSFSLEYPRSVWRNLSDAEKEFLCDNISYLNTACMPLVSGAKKVSYSTQKPFFKGQIDASIMKDMPSAVEEYREKSEDLLKKFNGTDTRFAQGKAKKPAFAMNTGERAIVPFSCGKDSLLTLAACSELGLNPVPVYVNDTVSPSENRLKIGIIRKIARKKKLVFGVVKNSIEKLNDFEFWSKPEADKGYSHLIIGFCFISLPFSKKYSAGYVILGNEYDLNFTLKSKEGIKCYPSYDQSFEGTRRLSRIMAKATSGKVKVGSVISPLYDLAIMKILHTRYPDFGKYQSSCPGLDESREKRWCQSCSDCFRFFLYMKAIGKDPKLIGIRQNMLSRKFLKYNVLLNPSKKGRYDKAGGDEQLKFAHYLAWKNGAKGYSIDIFRKKYLDEIREKEDRLYKKYFGVNSTSLIPKNTRKPAVSIYKEALAAF